MVEKDVAVKPRINDTSFVHLFRALDVSKMSSVAAKVYLILLKRCDYATGSVSMSLAEIMKDGGMTNRRTVISALKELMQLGYVSSDTEAGKKTVYGIIVTIPVKDGDQSVSFPYIPKMAKNARSEVVSYIAGEIPSEGFKYITINVTQHFHFYGEHSTVIHGDVSDDQMEIVRKWQSKEITREDAIRMMNDLKTRGG